MTENIKYEPKGDWWTAPCEAENSDLVMVTSRADVERFRNNPRYNIRVTVRWQYAQSGMPELAQSEQMGAVTEALTRCFDADPVAVLTGIYTGDGVREWVFYTLSLAIFGRKFNEALSALPELPLEFEAAEDPEWLEYAEVQQMRVD